MSCRQFVRWFFSLSARALSYDGQAKDDLRNHFKLIFFPGYQTIRVKIPLRNKRELGFNVHLPQHYETKRKEYNDNVERFMAGSPPPHEVAFNNLILRSQGTSFAPSETLSPTRRPVYLKREELGKGAFGRVRKVLDATTGYEYAGKEFFHKNGWEKEVEIMKYLRHPHIVQFVDSRTAPNPFIVMEYLPLGNLAAQDQVSSVSDTDMLVICNQMRYKNEAGWCVQHQGKSIFVADSEWRYCEQGGRPVIYCADLNVFTYRSDGNKRR
ncbi:hypothetical protein LTR92_011315 [Exophiala xenobiotica]|nr:hypothetical protein LTR92_011315 [Exophiala xenobiotica]